MAASGIYTLLALIVLTIIVILLLTTSKNSYNLIDSEYDRTIDILSQFVNHASLKLE